MEDRQPRNRRQFTAEFKRDAVDLVRSSDQPIAEIARELGIYDSTLGIGCVRTASTVARKPGLPATSRPGCERSSARTPSCGWSVTCSNEPSPSGQGTVDAVMRYRCVDAQKAAGFPVAAACQAAEVSRAAYYAWVARAGGSERQREEARLVGEIRRIHARSGGTYGVPRVHAELRRGGWTVNTSGWSG